MSDFNESLYFRDLNRHQTLPPNEEAVLLEIIKKNKESDEIKNLAMQRLIRGNLRFVVSVARKYQGRGLVVMEFYGNLVKTSNLFTTRKLLDAIKADNFGGAKTFLRDRYFPNVVEFETEKIDIDLVDSEGRKLAPFVNPKIGGKILDKSGYKTNTFEAPEVSPMRMTIADEMLTRSAGESVYGSKSPAVRAGEEAKKDLVVMEFYGNLVKTATATGNNTVSLLNRFLDSVPQALRASFASSLADSLKGIIVQHLIPVVGGEGLVLATESLKVSSTIANLLRKEEIAQIPAALASAKGTAITLDDSLKMLVDSGYIEGVEAWKRAFDVRNFATYRPGRN